MTPHEDTHREHRIIIAGFGGQGILTMGRLLCEGVIAEGRQVTYLPSYGSEVRGGTANCHVIISDDPIFSPIVESADSLVMLNQPSVERFGETLRPGGLLVVNASLAEPGDYEGRRGVVVLPVQATQMATDLGNPLVTNVLLLGALLEATQLCAQSSVEAALRRFLTGRRSRNLQVNLRALETGARFAADYLQES